MSDQLPTLDPPMHTAHRALLMRLITPKRLKRERGSSCGGSPTARSTSSSPTARCEFISEFASPFAMLVIADLLGVPEVRPRDVPRRARGRSGPASAVGSAEHGAGATTRWSSSTRGSPSTSRTGARNPTDDVLTGLATATFPDGSLPEVIDVVRIAANLFAAGQETTVRLLADALQMLGEQPELQELAARRARSHPELRRGDAALREPDQGRLPAVAGADDRRRRRHPRRHDGDGAHRRREPRPAPLRARPTSSSPTARTPASTSRSGTASHTCPGAPLARAEGRVSIERLLDRMRDITISEAEHGPRRRAPLRLRARRTSCAASPAST